MDELRAAGALDVPPEWRKSLSAGVKPTEVQRDLFSDLPADDAPRPEEPQEAPDEPDDEESADEPQ